MTTKQLPSIYTHFKGSCEKTDTNANNERVSIKVKKKTAGTKEIKVVQNESDRAEKVEEIKEMNEIPEEKEGNKEDTVMMKFPKIETGRWKPRKIRVFPRIREPDMTNETPEQTALRRLRSSLRLYLGHPKYNAVVCLSDLDLLTWLQPFHLNVYMTEAKLLEYYDVRKKMDLDSILVDYKPPEILKFHYTGGLCGVDRDGSPVWYELLCDLDMAGLVKSVTRDVFVKFKFYHLEMLKEEAKKSGTFQILVIVDMAGMTRESLGYALDMWIEFIRIVQRHYPYLVKEYVIINKPAIFTEFTLALRPYLDTLTRSKLSIFANDCHKHLLKRIEKHHIPACYGGYKCDVDNNPACWQDLVWNGEQVPTWMEASDIRLAANVHPLSILGGQRLIKETIVATPGSSIFWSFMNLTEPVVFSVYRSRIHPDTCVVKETLVSRAPDDNRSAVYVCKTAGRYLSILDNCKNYARPVKGFYNVNVVLPDWMTSKLTPQQPLGERFDMTRPVGEEEKKVIQWKRAQETSCSW